VNFGGFRLAAFFGIDSEIDRAVSKVSFL